MRVAPIIFLIVVFSFVLIASVLLDKMEGMETQISVPNPDDRVKITCPKVLIKKGQDLILYDDSNKELQRFSNLDEYIDYLKNERARGISCPVLFLQSENDTQGNDVFRIRPDIFNQEGGMTPVDVAPIIDASRSSNVYNVNNYPGFDPNGLQIGVYNTLDAIHDSTENTKISDNPLDTNWGGPEYTQQVIDSGKYEDNEIVKPTYFKPQTQFFPNLYEDRPVPKSYMNTDLSL